ncbi:MAG: DUF4476 domain-containing protein [Chitinophagaceae bacterium]|nr:DUF4476 domain-containing protein [Chitinophagaceae bacterium]
MKKLIITVLILLSVLQSFAGWNRGMLRIRDNSGRTITVSVDGRRYNKVGRTVTVGDLPSGYHTVKVYRYNTNGHGYANAMLMYQGSINVRPGRIYYCTVMRNQMDIEENCCIDDYGNWNNNDNWDNWDEEAHTWNNNRRWSDHDQWDDRNDDRPRPKGNYDENSWNTYKGVMSNGRYQMLIDQMRKASFETSKDKVARQLLVNERITVNQLIGVLKEFTFESTKVTFAKDFYRSLLDKENFIMVNDLFTFQSSKDEILDYIGQQR